jgi:hypothetical protein
MQRNSFNRVAIKLIRMAKIGKSFRKSEIGGISFLPKGVLDTAVDIFSALNKKRIRYMAIGAFPVNVYGRNRMSRDLDIAILLRKSSEFETLFPQSRYRMIDPDCVNERTRVARVRDRKTGILIDVILKPEEFTFSRNAFRRRVKVRIGKTIGYIPSVEDYLISKLKAGRAGTPDFQDVVTTLINNKNAIDWEYLENRAREENKLYLLRYYKDTISK